MTEQYSKIPSEEINATAEYDLPRAFVMLSANAALKEAQQKATGKKPHEPKFHEQGWSMAIETPKGIVGLWSCWLKKQSEFCLHYPKRTSFLVAELPEETVVRIANEYRWKHADNFCVPPKEDLDLAESREFLTKFEEEKLMTLLRQNDVSVPSFCDGAHIPDQLIMDTLGVEYAHPVRYVDYAGQIRKPQLWAKFYSPRVAGKRGRVWVDRSEDGCSDPQSFAVISDDSPEGLEDVDVYHSSREICTYSTSFWNKSAPDGPTTARGVIQSYRKKFITLMCEIARRMGGANAVNINYGFVLVPEQLPQLDYRNVEWLKGCRGVREGWGNEVVRAEKETLNGKETVVLRSGNELVPWSTIRRVPCDSNPTAKQIIELLTF